MYVSYPVENYAELSSRWRRKMAARLVRDGPLEKWWGMGGEKNKKKVHARENAKRKNPCKEEGKEKKFMQKEGPIVTFI